MAKKVIKSQVSNKAEKHVESESEKILKCLYNGGTDISYVLTSAYLANNVDMVKNLYEKHNEECAAFVPKESDIIDIINYAYRNIDFRLKGILYANKDLFYNYLKGVIKTTHNYDVNILKYLVEAYNIHPFDDNKRFSIFKLACHQQYGFGIRTLVNKEYLKRDLNKKEKNINFDDLFQFDSDSDSDIMEHPVRKTTILHEMCDYNYTDSIKILLDNGANMKSFDHRGRSPLLVALENGDGPNAFKLLIKNSWDGYPFEIHNVNGKNIVDLLLERARCSETYDDSAEYYKIVFSDENFSLKDYYNLKNLYGMRNKINNMDTILVKSNKSHHNEITRMKNCIDDMLIKIERIETLLEENTSGKKKSSCIIASSRGKLVSEIPEDALNESLYEAARNNHLSVVRELTKKNAALSCEQLNMIIRLYSVKDYYFDVIKLLLESNSVPNKQTSVLACTQNKDTNYELIEYLVKNKYFVYQEDIIKHVSKNNNYETMQLLINANMMDVNKALMFATIEKDTKMIELLLENGADFRIIRKADPNIKISVMGV